MSTQQQEIPRGFGARIQRAFLLALMAVVAINIWTGAPLLAVWVGSRVVESSTQVTMGSVLLIGVVIWGLAAWQATADFRANAGRHSVAALMSRRGVAR